MSNDSQFPTLELIGGYLKNYGFAKYKEVPEEGEDVGYIVTGWNDEMESFLLIIDPMNRPNVVRFQVDLLQVPKSATDDAVNEIVQFAASQTHRFKLGAIGYDYSTSTVSLSISVPIGDGPFAESVFVDCMNLATELGPMFRQGLKLLASGETIFDETTGKLKDREAKNRISELSDDEIVALIERFKSQEGGNP